MKLSRIIFPGILLTIIMVVFFLSCTKDKTPAPVEPCDPNKTYFKNDVLPLINSSCAKSGCHDATTKAEGLNLTNYAGVMKIVRAGKPSASDLVEVINDPGKDRMPPSPNEPLTQDQKDLITKWISEGALNNACAADTANCSTLNISFANDVKGIISLNCLGCHSGNNIGGGVNLSDHGGVKSAAASGKLYNAVAQNGSAVSMPPNMQLAACDIKKIKAWIDVGTPNN